MVKTYSGNYQVFASGLFFSFSEHDDFRLEITAPNGFNFSMYIKIVDDGGERNLEKNVNGNNMYFTCLNFGMGAGTSKPIEIATVGGKKMYIHFWLEAIDSSQQVHSLKYTIYTEE